MSEIIFMNSKGVQSFDGKEVKPLFRSVDRTTPEQKKTEFEIWTRLKTVYFPTWVWQEVCQRFPDKYKMFLPVYQGQRVILT